MEYLWIKAAHVSVVLIFIGGLIAQALGIAAGVRGADTRTVALVSRWDKRVTLPAMLAVWLTGALTASVAGLFSSQWLWAKLIVVVALSGLHGVQSGQLRRLRAGETAASTSNPFAIPVIIVVAAVLIAVLAVTKPF